MPYTTMPGMVRDARDVSSHRNHTRKPKDAVAGYAGLPAQVHGDVGGGVVSESKGQRQSARGEPRLLRMARNHSCTAPGCRRRCGGTMNFGLLKRITVAITKSDRKKTPIAAMPT